MNNYKKLRIKDYNGDLSKRWYVQYLYLDTDTNEWEPVRAFISNKLKTKTARYVAAKSLLEATREKLTRGYNPLLSVTQVNIRAALNKALKQKFITVGNRAYSQYKSVADMFCNWLVAKNLEHLAPEQLTKSICKEYFTECITVEKVNATTRNNRQNALSALFSEIIEDETSPLNFNVFKTIKRLQEAQPEIRAFTDGELSTLKAELEYKHPHLWLCALFVHYCFIRPIELTRLRVAALNFDNKTVSLPGKSTKNKSSNIIIMPDPVYSRLIEMGYHLLPKDLFIVSNHRKLTPGNYRIAPTRIAEAWKQVVIDNLKINKTIYLMKHTGAGKLMDKSKDPRAVQLQLRHWSLEETIIYCSQYSNTPNESLRSAFEEIKHPQDTLK